MPLRSIHLYGALRQFGPTLKLDVATPIETFRALMVNFPSAKRIITDSNFKIVVGHISTGHRIGMDEMSFNLGSRDLHIIPMPRGAGGRRVGGGKVVIGVIITAIAFYFGAGEAAGPNMDGSAGYSTMGNTAVDAGITNISYAQIANFGISMTLSGAAQMLSPTPEVKDYGLNESAADRPSFNYNGAVNTVELGATLPVIYGRARTGAILASGGLSVEQL